MFHARAMTYALGVAVIAALALPAQNSYAQSSYGAYNIRTPKAGTVYSIPVEPYDFVKASDPLVSVADLNTMAKTNPATVLGLDAK